MLLAIIISSGLFSEIGIGYKFDLGTSDVLKPNCSQVLNPQTLDVYSCGGDNPVFIGWPVGWEFPNGSRVGVFHMSHWFDGKNSRWGDRRETSFNCVCFTWKIDWSLKRD